MSLETVIPQGVFRVQRIGMIAAAVGIVGCIAGLLTQPEQFFRSYLFGFLFWVFLAFGATALLMVQHLSGGMWGLVNRRTLEAGSRTVPIVALLFLPVALGASHIYEWTHPESVSEIVRMKLAYLNVPFFIGRAAFYFLVWMVLAYFLNKWSLQQDSRASSGLTDRLENLSGAGLVLMALVITFASVDWAMSLSPDWFSTIYGVLFIIGQALAAFAFAIAVLVRLIDREPFASVVSKNHLHDLGNLLFAFLMLWAYITLSQLIIIWSANLPEEIPWYIRRFHGGWQWVGYALIVFHFAVPFVLLLMRKTKRSALLLAKVALAILAMRFVDLFWTIVPEFHRERFSIHWLDLAAPVALGGFWIAAYLRQLVARPLLVADDPNLRAEPAHE